MWLILSLIIFVLLIVVHEWGHFIAARRNGVAVEEFGIGFPPRLLGKRFRPNGTLYSLNLLPLGGFVKLKGEAAADKGPGTFGAAPFGAKVKILMAGVLMNLLAAVAMLMVLAWSGMPQVLPGQYTVAGDERVQRAELMVAQVVEDAPVAGEVAAGAKILAIDAELVATSEELITRLAPLAGETVAVTYEQAGVVQEREFTLDAHPDDGRGVLGIVPMDIQTKRYTWSAPLVALGTTWQMTDLTVRGVYEVGGQLYRGEATVEETPLAGPVGIFAILRGINDLGLAGYMIFIMAVISLSLALLNALPIPALDGGRLAVLGAFKALGRSLEPRVESAIHGTGFVLLILLIIVITVIDVQRFF